MSAASVKQNTVAIPFTLSDLLHADPAIAGVTEKDWLALVRAIAGGDADALRALFEKTEPLVVTYLMRMTGDRDVAETLMLEVFEGIWCEAPVFDSASTPVLGWIMRQARSCVSARADGAQSLEQSFSPAVASLQGGRAEASGRVAPEDSSLQLALDDLSAAEREILEAALIDGLA
ncbi:MAG: hypothetical protein SXG53_21800, partial [Pseudomonadota bacterium]|nr:hypothetical protein [Pseudomonadota bacterium]